jgi:hypothetical protein
MATAALLSAKAWLGKFSKRIVMSLLKNISCVVGDGTSIGCGIAGTVFFLEEIAKTCKMGWIHNDRA